MRYQVTIYSPEDKQEHIFETFNPEAVAARLIISMEVGAWIKVERLPDTNSAPEHRYEVRRQPVATGYSPLMTDMTL